MAIDNPITRPVRRSFLALITGAAVAPVAVALPAAAAITGSAEPALAEAPELLELGERLATESEALQSAVAEKQAALALYERLRPTVPAELIRTNNSHSESLLTQGETSVCPIGGRGDSHTQERHIYQSRLIRSHLAMYEVNGRTREGRRLHRLARLAKSHELRVDAAFVASGFDRCDDAVREAGHSILRLSDRLLKLEPVGMQGLAIYARALEVACEASCAAGYAPDNHTTRKLGRRLAAGVLRIEAARAGVST